MKAMNMTPNVTRMLTVSIAHLRPEQGATLNADWTKPDWGPHFGGEIGWIWYVDMDTLGVGEYPEEFTGIFKHALSLGCQWVRLDEGGDLIPGLPTWEW